MNPIRQSLERPTAVIAAVMMVILFGFIALSTIPIQLTPDVRRPVLIVTTTWIGAAPAEIEREIVNRQEEALTGVDGLEEITSRSEEGRGRITLEFAIGTDMNRSLLLVANRLDRVNGYPEEADEPVIATSGEDDARIAWWVIKRMPGNDRPIHTYRDFIDEVVRARIERVEGVSTANFYGGGEREMRVIVDPSRMARYRLTVPQVVSALRAANASVSGGNVDEGKRRYTVRTDGDLKTPEQVRNVVLRTSSDADSGRIGRVTVGDIADVGFDHKDATAQIRNLGEMALAINAVRESGANVIEVMERLRKVVADLAEGPLKRERLVIEQVYDETIYIDSAIELVRQNIVVGGVLAALTLLLFLRSLRATLVVSLAIPVSVIGSFVAMAALGRSLNVISLAGIAFAVGMVVDAAIVVLENIYRYRQSGLPVLQAAYRGAAEVWGAILVSALTTVLVFVPILIMELEVGQLFRDIAVAISVSVLLSLVVSVTVVPALSNWLLGANARSIENRLYLPGVDDFARAFHGLFVGFARLVVRSRMLAAVTVLVLCGMGAAATWLLLPKLDYLPSGNRNLIIGFILPPPGYNLDTTQAIARDFEEAVSPMFARPDDPAALDPDGPPRISSFFFVAFRSNTIIGARAADPKRVKELIPLLSRLIFREPGTFGFVSQRSLFGRSFSGSRGIDLHISGGNLEEVLEVATRAAGLTFVALPREEGNQFRPQPGLELGAPEVRVTPDPLRLADAGISAQELGLTIDVFNDGVRVAEITVDGERIDLTLMGRVNGITATQGINNLPVVIANGRIVPASSLAKIAVTAGPTEIRHVERERTVTLEITPREDMPLENAMDLLREKVIDPLLEQGLPPGINLTIAGTAEKLQETWSHIQIDLLVAVVIVYLVMVVLFESFLYPLIILLSVPLATAGGVIGLALLNLYTPQKLDMLTMLGFIILIGIVVNNAILLVHQTLHHLRSEGMSVSDAIVEATSNRIRPIFMSTLTSVVGMLPLVLFPGAGSELYRGLGSVVLGGLSLSAVLTLAIIPSLLSLFTAVAESRRRPAADEAAAGQPQAAE